MRDIRIVARVLDDTSAGKSLAQLLEGERETRPRSARQGDGNRRGETAEEQCLIGRAGGGGGAGAGRPSLAQIGFLTLDLLSLAHRKGNAFS